MRTPQQLLTRPPKLGRYPRTGHWCRSGLAGKRDLGVLDWGGETIPTAQAPSNVFPSPSAFGAAPGNSRGARLDDSDRLLQKGPAPPGCGMLDTRAIDYPCDRLTPHV